MPRKEIEEDERLLRVVKQVSPGTALRASLDRIISSKSGALIVLGDDSAVMSICDGGFKIDCEFTDQRLFELAKMDGAIILSQDASRIHLANVHLVPNPGLPTTETGMRHRTAERVALQTGKTTISVSESRELVTLYAVGTKYALEDLRMLLAKANQALQTLEKYRYRLERVATNLGALEFEDLVTLADVAIFLQRGEMMERVANEIRRYIAELGTEGRLISLQLDELMAGVEEDMRMVMLDYKAPAAKRTPDKMRQMMADLDDDEFLDVGRVCSLLGYRAELNVGEMRVYPKGYRLLSRVPRLPSSVVLELGKKFGSLQKLLQASLEQLDEVEGVGEIRARAISDNLQRLRENAFLERYT